MQYKVKRAYIYPAESQNRFLELNKNAISQIGFEVKPVDKNFYRREILGARDSYVIINWAEDLVYPAMGCSIFEQGIRFLKTIILIIFSRLFAKKVIWVRHNFKPHNAKGSVKRYSAILLLYKILGISEVSLEDYYSTPSLTHPLYITNQEILKKIDESSDAVLKYDVVFFGAIKRYKNLHNLLKSWPTRVKLKIAGRCNEPHYKAELLEIIGSRKLKVTLDDKFLSDKELNELLQQSRFVLLPHADATMISSGTFYHAISHGCNVLITESKFGVQKSLEHDFVHLYNPEKLSNSFLDSIFVTKPNVYAAALKHYGQESVVDSWRVIFESIRPRA